MALVAALKIAHRFLFKGDRLPSIDNSPAMVEKAKADDPQQDWKQLDAGKDGINEKFDLVFSNATIQWIPNHAELLKKFHGIK